ncbi:MAG TPA: hypothetical protein VF534_28720 [Paraburkholderia sp.]
MDNALSFQKKRNETTGLDEVPAVRASCFVAWLPVGAPGGGFAPESGRPARRGKPGARANARRNLFAGYFTDFDTGGN